MNKSNTLKELLEDKNRNIEWWRTYARIMHEDLTPDLKCNGKPMRKKVRIEVAKERLDMFKKEIAGCQWTFDDIEQALLIGEYYGYGQSSDEVLNLKTNLLMLKELYEYHIKQHSNRYL